MTQPPPPPPPPRLGPRPLPLHLLTQGLTLLGSHVALPHLKSGSWSWKPRLQPRATLLEAALAAVDPQALTQALTDLGQARIHALLDGIQAYRQHPHHRVMADMPVVWQDGATRLLDYSLPDATGTPVLVIPSLVNRGYILDLSERRSLMRALAERGLRPFLVDWGTPGPVELSFSLDDYILNRLNGALDAVLARAGRPALVGYCMGGLLALALGLWRMGAVRGLAVLATPWDFHKPHTAQAQMIRSLGPLLEQVVLATGQLSVDGLQTLFTTIDPAGIERKFRHFARLRPDSAKARDFVILEDWLNDGVPLAGAVARQSLFGWYRDNLPALGQWQVGGRFIRPQEFYRPAVAMIPQKDRIVPPESALALAEALPQVRTKIIRAGHIGMVCGSRARTDTYTPLAREIDRMVEF